MIFAIVRISHFSNQYSHMKGQRLNVLNQNEIDKCFCPSLKAEERLRLIFLKTFLTNNQDLEITCSNFGISVTTGYNWIQKWNDYGLKGLSDRPITGRRAKLTNEDIEKLKNKLKEKGCWDISEISLQIKEMFNIEFKSSRLKEILSNLGMNYSKPYRKDYRRPDNAEELLINSINEAIEKIISNGVDVNDVVLGFVDEAHPQNKANTAKFWSFGKAVLTENTTKYKVNTIGFYSLNGNDALMFLEDSKDEGIAQFFVEIRNKNPEPEAIIVILDNLSSHKTKLCHETASALGIYLVFIPPYSPDLNPIEFVWKSLRRMISKFFVNSKNHLEDIISHTYEALVSSLSFANRWLEKIVSKIKPLSHLNVP
jgi:transposase